MKAILLAAGKGVRLGPLGEDRPKCLLPINGSTVLDYFCASLRATGIVSQVLVVGGHCLDVLRQHLPEGATLVENPRYATTNSLYSLWLALQRVGNEDFAVFNADVVYEPNLLGRFLHHPYGTACLVDELRRFDACEFHVVVKDGLVREHSRSVCEAASHGQCAQAFKVSGDHAALFKDRVGEQIRSGASNSYACRPYDVLMENELLHPVYTNNDSWSEFDSEEDYERCKQIFGAHDALAQCLSIYGAGRSGAPAGSTGGGASATASLASMLRNGIASVRHGELPWHLRWMPRLAGVSCRAPLRVLPHTWRVATGALSPEGLKLRLFGPALLKAVMEEAGKLRMRPFLLWGSLLGCVRENGFLRKDHDIDLGLLDSDFQRIGELEARLLARGLRVRLRDDYKISFLSGGGDGLFVDIDRVYEERDHMVITNASADYLLLYSYLFPRGIFATVRSGSLEGVAVGLPGEPEAFLEVVYGNWKVPQHKREYLRGPLNLCLEARVAVQRPPQMRSVLATRREQVATMDDGTPDSARTTGVSMDRAAGPGSGSSGIPSRSRPDAL